jgi:methionyl-tRNA formyltransferase
MKYNVVFFASPEFAVKILQNLTTLDFINVRAVVTNPDKPQGRKQILTPTPIAAYAQEVHLPVFKPQKLDDQNLAHLKLFSPDIFIVVAYGKIIPTSYLNTPKIATLNVHYSLLPKYRGALCVKEAIANGDPQTGVTLMEMDEALDHGAIISTHILKIESNHQIDTLTNDLTDLSIKHLGEDLKAYIDYKVKGTKTIKADIFLPPTPQDESQATFTAKTRENTKANSFVSFSDLVSAMDGKNAHMIDAKIRSNTPEPGSWTKITTQKGEISLNILKSHLDQDKLSLDIVQIPGKNPVTWKQFTSGYQLKEK